jgi:uncharacterized protein
VTQSAPTYAPGVAMWVDLATRDVQGSANFYGQLFGWQAEDMGEQAGHYNMFRQDGKMVAAATPPMNEQQPTVWATYFCTTNAAATAQAVKDAGGQVVVEPFEVMDQGSMGVFADPAGAIFCVWQPAAHKGAELVNTPNSLCWNELATRDLERAKAFYPRVFGWGVRANPMPQGGEYVEWQVDGRSVAGAQPMGSQYPSQVPPHWLVYFAVADCDATVTRAQQLGARVSSPCMDIPQGRFAILSDPQGATFGVIRL